jgi:hypothetical protein
MIQKLLHWYCLNVYGIEHATLTRSEMRGFFLSQVKGALDRNRPQDEAVTE